MEARLGRLFANEEGRLRAGWRLLAQFLLYNVGVSVVGALILGAIVLDRLLALRQARKLAEARDNA